MAAQSTMQKDALQSAIKKGERMLTGKIEDNENIRN